MSDKRESKDFLDLIGLISTLIQNLIYEYFYVDQTMITFNETWKPHFINMPQKIGLLDKLLGHTK